MTDSRNLKIDYRSQRNLREGPGAYITNVIGHGSFSSGETAVRLRMAVVHLGAMLNDGADACQLKTASTIGSILSVVLDPQGRLKVLGPWAAPVNGDVVILGDLQVQPEHRRQGLAVTMLNDALRAFAGSCGYVILPSDALEMGLVKALESYGFAQIATGLLALAMDYTPSLVSQRLARHPELLPMSPAAVTAANVSRYAVAGLC